MDETPLDGEKPEVYVQRLAEMKALAVDSGPDETVLGADTTVVIDGEMLGKPVDAADAGRMLAQLAGRRHEVLTGICIRRGTDTGVRLGRHRGWFLPMTEQEIAAYVASGEPMDKAGAYAIQGLASKFIEKIEGCYFNVVGLPDCAGLPPSESDGASSRPRLCAWKRTPPGTFWTPSSFTRDAVPIGQRIRHCDFPLARSKFAVLLGDGAGARLWTLPRPPLPWLSRPTRKYPR